MLETAILILLVFIIIGFSIFIVTVYNGLIRLKRNIEKAWANIDVLLNQRYDEIPKLVKICEQFAQYERSTLEKVIALRSEALKANNLTYKALKEDEISKNLSKIFAIGEAYPDLKSNVNIMQLQKRISELESEIADRRELYNDSVNLYNIRIEQFPDTFIANVMRLKSKQMFKVEQEKMKDIKISLNLTK